MCSEAAPSLLGLSISLQNVCLYITRQTPPRTISYPEPLQHPCVPRGSQHEQSKTLPGLRALPVHGRDGEQELIESMLRSEPPESKLLLGLLSGSVITVGALFICWLSGSNPAGVNSFFNTIHDHLAR